MISDKEKHRISELENDLNCALARCRAYKDSINLILAVAGCSSLAQVEKSIQKIIDHYEKKIKFDWGDADFEDAVNGVIHDRSDMILEIEDIQSRINSFLDKHK